MVRNSLINKDKYIAQDNATFFEVLSVINSNKKRFAVICKEEKVVGVVTDGDVRRSLLSGYDLNDKVCFKDDFKFVNYDDEFETVSEVFRDYNLDFILILQDGFLFNILNKNQFHIMLLEDIKFSTDIDYRPFDRNLVHEIFNRPWGFYKSVLLNTHAQAKILTIFPDSETSLQYHKRREEHWVVIKGCGDIIRHKERRTISPGQYVHIPKECVHQIINTSIEENLVLSEVQLGEYFGEDDIIRLDDKYGRI
jgi:mannose-1-phosphate guanylyltransferase/mannose-6-phosphate isomerase